MAGGPLSSGRPGWWTRQRAVYLPGAALLVPLCMLGAAQHAVAVFNSTTVNSANSFTTSTLQPPTGLSLSSTCPGATVTATWTATSSTYATGYILVRKSGGTAQNTINVSGRTTVTQDDTNVSSGTYTYELSSVYANWTSNIASANTTVSCVPQLTNAGFEAANLSGWTCTGGTPSIVTSPVHGGTYAAQINGGGTAVQCSQVISGLTPNHAYTFTMWINSSGTVGSVGYILGGTNSSNGGSGAGWIQKSISLTTGPSDTSVTFYFKTTGTVTFDDAVLS
jgi:hypothetical protein